MTTNSDSVDVKATPENTTTPASVDETAKNVEDVPQTTETTSGSEFTRANIEALGTRIRVTDSDEKSGLELFCYTKCSPNEEGLIRECRGVVFHRNDLVMKAFPYTIEYEHTDTAQIEQNIQPVFDKCTFYDAHEGTLIRMFNFSGKWYTCTHRKLNAFRSKWASRESFGTAFKRALETEVNNNQSLRDSFPTGEEGLLERFQSTLDPIKQYMFLIRNSEENRIVCRAPKEPTMYHVGTFVDGELVMTENINVPYPAKHTFLNMDDLCHAVSKMNPADIQGVIVFAPDNKQYKILHKEYMELFRARGNEPSIKFRFLQVLLDAQKCNMLYYLYPEMVDMFEDYKNTLYDIGVSIHRAYVQRFIRREHFKMPPQEWIVMKECHAWYNEDRANRYVNLDKVLEVLHRQPATNLNHMIRHFHSGEQRKQDVQNESEQRTRSNTVGSTPNITGASPSGKSPMLIGGTTEARHSCRLSPGPNLGQPAYKSGSRKGERVLSEEYRQ